MDANITAEYLKFLSGPSKGPDALTARESSPRLLDIMLWAGHRAFGLSEPRSFSWTELQTQFGAPNEDAAQFRAAFQVDLRIAVNASPTLTFEATQGSLILKSAPEGEHHPA